MQQQEVGVWSGSHAPREGEKREEGAGVRSYDLFSRLQQSSVRQHPRAVQGMVACAQPGPLVAYLDQWTARLERGIFSLSNEQGAEYTSLCVHFSLT